MGDRHPIGRKKITRLGDNHPFYLCSGPYCMGLGVFHFMHDTLHFKKGEG